MIKFNKVTWYSKLVAVILFVGTFVLAFWLGAEHEKTNHLTPDARAPITQAVQ